MYANSGNLSTRPNHVASWTDGPIVSPVPSTTLADFLAVDQSDPLLQGLLNAATAAVIDYTCVQVIKRHWHYRADRYPERQPAMLGVGATGALPSWWVTLPAWPAVDVNSVTADSYEFDQATNRVWTTGAAAPLVIEYTAGYDDTPGIYLTAIMQMAAYMYDHRGGCDAGQSGRDSGAFGMLQPRKRYGAGL